MNTKLFQLLLLVFSLSGILNAELKLWYNEENLPFLGIDQLTETQKKPLFTLGQFHSGLVYENPELKFVNFSHFLSYDFDSISNLQYPALGAIWSPGYFHEYQSADSTFSFKATNRSQQLDQQQVDSSSFAMNTSYKVSTQLSIAGGAEVNSSYNSANDVLFERDTYSLPISVFYSINPTTDISLNYKKSYTNTKEPATTYYDDKFTLGLHNKINDQVETGINIGVQTRENGNGQLNHKLAGGSTIRYKFNENTEIGSSVSKDFAIGPKGENMEKLQTTLEVDFALNELVFVGTNLAMLNYEYIDTGEETDLANAGLHFKYRDGDLFNLSAGYSVSTPDLDRKLNKRMGHLLNFSASIQF